MNQPRSQDTGKRLGIVLLMTDDFTRPWVCQLADGFRKVPLSSHNPPVLYIETLDAARLDDEVHVEQRRDWLRLKYRGRRVQVRLQRGWPHSAAELGSTFVI